MQHAKLKPLPLLLLAAGCNAIIGFRPFEANSTGSTTDAVVGGSCTESDRVACAKSLHFNLICDGSTWQRADGCAESERCDTREGPTQGQCMPYQPACEEAAGKEVCAGDVRLQCGPDAFTAQELERCDKRACLVHDGTTECKCPTGYTGDGVGDEGCQDENECETDNGGCDQKCVNMVGSHRCEVCTEGFEGRGCRPKVQPVGMGGAGAGGGGGAGGAPAPVIVKKLGETGCSAPNVECARGECLADRCLIAKCGGDGTECEGALLCCTGKCVADSCNCGASNGASCTNAKPCCSGFYCVNGGCLECLKSERACVQDYQCCAGLDCYQNTCRCRPMGTECEEGKSNCCGDLRCRDGMCQTCGPTGASCTIPEQCCSGTCSAGTCILGKWGGPQVGSAALRNEQITVADQAACANPDIGKACTTSSECCSGTCFDGKCDLRCLRLGETCTIGQQCCSGLCVDNTCVFASCQKTAEPCTAHLNCCSGTCNSGQCAAP